MSTEKPFQPEDLAQRWGISVDQVCRLIKAGAIPGAFSVARPGAKKARWRIPLAAVVDYETLNVARPPVEPTPRRRRPKEPAGFVNYF